MPSGFGIFTHIVVRASSIFFIYSLSWGFGSFCLTSKILALYYLNKVKSEGMGGEVKELIKLKVDEMDVLLNLRASEVADLETKVREHSSDNEKLRETLGSMEAELQENKLRVQEL